ncbi:MAG TPA: LysM peptidoglycan-binding domain-containing protein [Phycisphaerales bacterium]|nr:LysM peptidoglycan-binding domain-containing protein [Phycisphaerales bacterium]
MTRELKLALIVGFLLVLLVSVLIADHLSGARKAELASNVTPNPAIAPVIAPAPQEPLVTIEQGKSGGIKFADNTPAGGAVTTPNGQLVANDVISEIGARTGEPVPPPMVGTAKVGPLTISATGTPDQVLGTDTLQGNQQPSPDNTTVADGIKKATEMEVKPFGGDTVKLAGNGVTVLPEPKIVPPAPAASEDQWYTIAQGDSAFKIAKKFYGKGEYWKQLQAYNGDRIGKDGTLRVGVRVKIPEASKLGIKDAPVTKVTEKTAKPETQTADKTVKTADKSKPDAKPATTAGRTYTVKKGDTLGQIAQRELGTMKRADEIVKLNKLKDAGSIREGMKLNLPAK